MFAVAPLTAGAAPKPKPTAGTATIPGVAGTVISPMATSDATSDATEIGGLFTDTAGNTTRFVTDLLGAAGPCRILHPNQVVQDITAQSGAGSLLGNRCARSLALPNTGSLPDILEDLTAPPNQIFRST